MSSYDPSKWYWIVAGDEMRVWSSAAVAYVPATDAGYTAWLAEGNMATRIVSEAELQEVLAQQYPAGWPPNPVQVAFAGPLAVTCTSIPALNGNYAIDQQTQAQITGIAAAISAGLGLPGGGSTFNWPDAEGTAHAWPEAQFTAFAKGVLNYLYGVAQFAAGHQPSLPPRILTIA
jgi:hypothetical protein